MKKNHSIGLRFTIAIWWFSVITAPVMGGCKNETKTEKPRKLGGFSVFGKNETKTKNHGKWVVFPFLEKTKRKREMGGFPCFEKREMGGFPRVSLC